MESYIPVIFSFREKLTFYKAQLFMGDKIDR